MLTVASVLTQAPTHHTVTYALQVQTDEFAPQAIDLTQTWSTEVTDYFEYDDFPAMVAAVNIYVELHLLRSKGTPRSLRELLPAFAALLLQRQCPRTP